MTNHERPGRRETEDERMDRKFADLLQELRVMQTGAQLTAGFLLTLPFQQRFEDLDVFQVRLYLALVLLAAGTTALVLGPVAVHRRLSGEHVKERVIAATHWLVYAALATVGLLVAGMVTLIFDVVTERTTAVAAGAGAGLVLVLLLVVTPQRLTRRGS
jgi:fumarate reductase subunit C